MHVKALIASREYENYESAARLCLDEIMNREAESKSMDQQDGLHTFFMTNLLQLHLLCGRALHLSGDLETSQKTLKQAYSRFSHERFVEDQSKEKSEAMKETQGEMHAVKDMQTRRECGNFEFRNQKYAKAYDAYSGALQLDPSHDSYCALLYCNRAAALMNLGLFSEAIDDCNEALKRRSYYPKAILRRSRALRESNRFQEAIRDLTKVLSNMRTRGDTAYDPVKERHKAWYMVPYDKIVQELKECRTRASMEESRKQRTQQRAKSNSGMGGTSRELMAKISTDHRILVVGVILTSINQIIKIAGIMRKIILTVIIAIIGNRTIAKGAVTLLHHRNHKWADQTKPIHTQCLGSAVVLRPLS